MTTAVKALDNNDKGNKTEMEEMDLVIMTSQAEAQHLTDEGSDYEFDYVSNVNQQKFYQYLIICIQSI